MCQENCTTIADSRGHQPPAIPTEIAIQREALDVLHDRLDLLESRLDHVLLPAETPLNDAAMPRGIGVVLADMLSTSNERIQGATDRVARIIDRLAL